MLLRDLSLFLDTLAFDRVLGGDFGFRVYHVLNYVNRQIRPIRFKSSAFSGIAVRGCLPEHSMECKVEGENVLVADVSFDKGDYAELASEREFQEFVIDMLLRGVELARKNYDVPYQEIEEAVDGFRRSGYKNEWVHKKRLFRGLNGLRGSLTCKLDSQKFTLTLQLERGGNLLYESEILETRPDPVFFHHMFKDLVVEGNKLVVTRSRSRTLLELDLSQLISS